jgi:GTPase SAR1 family protein
LSKQSERKAFTIESNTVRIGVFGPSAGKSTLISQFLLNKFREALRTNH